MTRPRAGKWWRRWIRDDRGSATGWAIGIFLIALLGSALLVDGGRAMTVQVDTIDAAQEAARAGADQIDLLVLRTTGVIQLDPTAAATAAQAFLATIGATGTATATTTVVTVTVTRTRPTLLLNQIGINSMTLAWTATAQPITT
jgi:hypothetical protein